MLPMKVKRCRASELSLTAAMFAEHTGKPTELISLTYQF